jgi:D-alanyl-D-alanine carboxypeptidase/D-alanyl-D-alanine-endopeptidase (penicillin-binding protein 4)
VIRRILVVVLLVGVIACGVLAVTAPDDTAEAQSAPAALSTAGWSARRVPQPFVDAVGATHLQGALDEAVNGSGNDACFTVLTAAGPVASRSADTPYLGASTQKLMTGAAALAVLGPDSTFTTRVTAAGDPASGTVDKLFLVGGGDPLLSTADFRAFLDSDPKTAGTPSTSMEALADAVVAKGVRRVNALVVDDTRQDQVRYLPQWSPSYKAEGQIGPLGALTVNHGFSKFTGTKVAVDDGALFAGDQFARLLRARGVTVNGAIAHGKEPEGANEVARIDSAPVSAIVAESVSSSDNGGTEDLIREIGVKASKDGSTAAGVAAAAAKLAELGVPMTGVSLVDGSGLARDNRVTCRALAYTMDLGVRPEFKSLLDGLSVAGVSGTLADELLGTGLEGRLKGKTGFLNGVTGLAGIVDVGRPLRFALVVNGTFGEATAIRIRGQLAQIIARFPEAPSAEQLVPVPVPPVSPRTGPVLQAPAPTAP